jgi:hypothetical protein
MQTPYLPYRDFVIPHRLSSFTFIASHFISRLLPIMSVKRVLVIAGSDSSGGA